MAAPAPPPGFTLDDPNAPAQPRVPPPLPPGFSFDQAASNVQMRPIYPMGGRPELGQQPYMQIPAPGQIAGADDANFGAALKSNLVEDEQTKKRLIADSLFPGDPRGIDRVGLIDGKPVFVNDQGVLQYVSGAATRGAAGLVANSPEMIAGTVGALAGSPVIGSTIAATGARGLKRTFANLVFDEPQTVAGNAADLGIEAAANLAGAVVGKGVAGFAGRARPIDFTPRQLSAAEQTRQHVWDRIGVDLDLAVASGDRKLIAVREYAAKYPGRTADLIEARDEIMQGQFNSAVDRVLNMVADAKPDEVAGQNAISAAEAILRLTKKEIQQKVSPIYRAAYESATEITDPKILQLAELKDVKQSIAKARYTIALENRGMPKAIDRDPKTLEPILVDANDPLSLEVLDLTKQHLDDRVEDLVKNGDNRTAVALADVRDDIKDFLDNISTRTIRARNPKQTDTVISLYKQARAEYGRLYQERMTPLENSPVGVLAKMHPQNAALAANVLRRSNVTPQQIAVLKGGLSRSNPEAYKDLVRLYLGQEWDTAQAVSQSGDVINPAGKFLSSVFRTPAQRDRVVAMLPPKTAEVLEDVMFAAERLAKTPLGSSRQPGPTTARDQLITEQLKYRALSALRWIIAPKQSIKEAAEDRALETGIESLTEALLDPTKRAQLKQITKMQPSTQQAIMLASILGGQGIQTAVGGGDATALPAQMVPRR